jgi:hypothetical protein
VGKERRIRARGEKYQVLTHGGNSDFKVFPLFLIRSLQRLLKKNSAPVQIKRLGKSTLGLGMQIRTTVWLARGPESLTSTTL